MRAPQSGGVFAKSLTFNRGNVLITSKKMYGLQAYTQQEVQ